MIFKRNLLKYQKRYKKNLAKESRIILFVRISKCLFSFKCAIYQEIFISDLLSKL